MQIILTSSLSLSLSLSLLLKVQVMYILQYISLSSKYSNKSEIYKVKIATLKINLH